MCTDKSPPRNSQARNSSHQNSLLVDVVECVYRADRDVIPILYRPDSAPRQFAIVCTPVRLSFSSMIVIGLSGAKCDFTCSFGLLIDRLVIYPEYLRSIFTCQWVSHMQATLRRNKPSVNVMGQSVWCMYVKMLFCEFLEQI